MTAHQKAEMARLKRRVRILERHSRSVSKAALDRLIWLVTTIEEKPKADRFIRVPLSASDGKLLRRLAEGLVNPK